MGRVGHAMRDTPLLLATLGGLSAVGAIALAWPPVVVTAIWGAACLALAVGVRARLVGASARYSM